MVLTKEGGVQAYVVHCTFQWHHTPGKRARLREHGLWLPDPPDYFKASHFMTYDNDVREYITNLDAKASSPLPSLFKHFHAMSYQLAQMRDAFAMARALNRTLVCSSLAPNQEDHSFLPCFFLTFKRLSTDGLLTAAAHFEW
jgi:hypothetical protein